MKLLLDTHTFIWWDRQPDLIPSETLELMQQSELLLSLVSIWEMQIKTQLGKLKLNMSLGSMVQHQEENGVILLPIKLAHILELGQLPMEHNDPFDRLLIAQSRVESIAIVSRDRTFTKYSSEVVW